MKTYNFGTTPKEVILQALKEQLGDKPYEMTLSRSDEPVIVKCVNQGIDSHLEGITELAQSREQNPCGSRLHLEFGHNSLLVLLRRLLEEGSDEAHDLRSCILETLRIEEV